MFSSTTEIFTAALAECDNPSDCAVYTTLLMWYTSHGDVFGCGELLKSSDNRNKLFDLEEAQSNDGICHLLDLSLDDLKSMDISAFSSDEIERHPAITTHASITSHWAFGQAFNILK